MKGINFFTDAFLIGILTLSGYITAFLYKYGYLSYFDAPPEFIELSIAAIIGAVLSISVFVLIFILFLDLLGRFSFLKGNTASQRIKRMSILLITYSLTVIVLYKGDRTFLLLYAGVIVVILLIEFLFPLLFHRDKKTWEEKASAQEEVERKAEENSLLDRLFNALREKIGASNYGILFILILILLHAKVVGNAEAVTQDSFFVLQPDANKAVIGITEQEIIAVEFDRNTKQLSGKVYVIKTNKNPNIELMKEKIGPLVKIKRETTPAQRIWVWLRQTLSSLWFHV